MNKTHYVLAAAIILNCSGIRAQKSTEDISSIDTNFIIEESATKGLTYHGPDSPHVGMQGLYWFAKDGLLRRMPEAEEGHFPGGVEKLAWHTAGAQLRFRTDSRKIELRAKLRPYSPMPHMPLSGQCGFDLFAGNPGEQRFVRAAIPKNGQTEIKRMLITSGDGKMMDYTINFPLYAGVEEVAIGVESKARIEPPSPTEGKGPIVLYSGSTLQGACATRPGNATSNMLSRKLNRECLNFGFSGSGRIEPEVGEVLASIADAELFIIGPDSNSTMQQLEERFENFLDIIRSKHPLTPILVLTRHRRGVEALSEIRGTGNFGDRPVKVEYLKKAVEARQNKGDTKIFFHDGADLLGDDFENCSVDGSHPNDMGFYRMAQYLEPIIRRLLRD